MASLIIDKDLAEKLESTGTVSDKIRLLNTKGYPRAEIARILGKKYQHVRNVLENDIMKATSSNEDENISKPPTVDEVLRFDVASDGRIKLPWRVLKALQIPSGGTLSGRLENGQLTLVEPLVALRRVQKALAPLRQRLLDEGVSIVDELIAERRALAAQGE